MAKRVTLCTVVTTLFFSAPIHADDLDLVPYVNTFIGTDNGAPDYGMGNAAGNTPPGAAYPFGMVLWSPDTTTRAGGYRYYHDTINGFSLTHFSGRGLSCYQDVPLMPVIGPIVGSPGNDWSRYSSKFTHSKESAEPGYYGVVLDSGIQVDLTVTAHTGLGRFAFPASAENTILINAGGSARRNREGGTGVDIDGSNRVTGSAASGNCGGSFTYTVYFAVEFDEPFVAFGTWNGREVEPGSTSSSGSESGAYVTFQAKTVQAKVGLSFVSVANAWQNLRDENPRWDFKALRGQTRSAWNSRLNSIQIRGGPDDQKTVFYTALYHSFIHPSIFSDTNGDYIGFDGKIHAAESFKQYHNFAGWDNYRCQIPLLAVIAPREAADMMQSLVNDAQQDRSGGLPRWQHANTNSGGMVGDSQDAAIASVYAFGVTDFDLHGALEAMDKGASQIGATSGGHTVREGLRDYLELGYVSTATGGSAARTLEYVNDDFSISQFARALGDMDLYAQYLWRAQNWRNLFHKGYIVPRSGNGDFSADFRPSNRSGFVEGSGAQYVWMVPFNFRGLFDQIGGNAVVIDRLDHHFKELNAGPGSEFAFMGNEPEFKAPWAYAFAGAPWRTQAVVRRILLELFSNSPGGVPGNDDGGAMGSWVVWGALGLFPEIPAVGGFVVGSPLFPSISVRLAAGTLEINAPGASDGTPFIQALNLNGQEHNSPWIPWERIAGGATLDFSLGDKPNIKWGARLEAAPPSFDAPEMP